MQCHCRSAPQMAPTARFSSAHVSGPSGASNVHEGILQVRGHTRAIDGSEQSGFEPVLQTLGSSMQSSFATHRPGQSSANAPLSQSHQPSATNESQPYPSTPKMFAKRLDGSDSSPAKTPPLCPFHTSVCIAYNGRG